MKIKITGILFLFVLLTGCTNETDDSLAVDSSENYFPLAEENYWEYQNVSEPQNQPAMESEDSLYVAENNANGYTMEAQPPIEGFMTSLLHNGTLKKENNQLLFSGNYQFLLEGFDAVQIPLQNVVMYDVNANAGTELFTASNVIEQTFSGIPMQMEYTVSTTHEGLLDSYNVEGTTYENVLSSQFVLNLEISTSIELFGNTINIPILAAQDVLVGQNYYAEGIGMVYSHVTFNYELEDLSQYDIEIPLEQSATVISTQRLTNYEAVPED